MTTNDLFEIEINDTKERGRFLKRDRDLSNPNAFVSEPCRFRHLNSGKLLTIRERNKYFIVCLANDPAKEDVEFYLDSTLFCIELTIHE